MTDYMDNITQLANYQDSGEKISPTSEEAMALTFVDRHGDRLRYVAAWGRWLDFDGTRWAHDDTLHAFDLARAIAREVAATQPKPANTIASAKTVAAIEKLAKADRQLAAIVSQWDAGHWLLNTEDDDDEREAGD